MFNEVLLLDKQCCRLVENDNLLAVRVLKVRYYFNCSLNEVFLGSKLSYIWRSIWGVRWMIKKGIRGVCKV